MPRRRTLLLVTCLFVNGALAAGAAADLVLQTRTEPLAEPALGAREGRIWLDGTSLRLELQQPGHSAGGAVVIFRSDRELYWALDESSRSYLQLDRDEMQQLGRRVAQARREMAARLDSLPPDERAVVERMLADMQPPHADDAREQLVPRESTRTIDGKTARLRELVLDERVVGQIWVVDWAEVGVEQDELRVFGELAAFQRALIETLGRAAGASFGGEPFEIFDRLDGYPLLIRRLHEGTVESETRFGRPQRVPPDEGRYRPPEDYRRRAGPGSGDPAGAPPPPHS